MFNNLDMSRIITVHEKEYKATKDHRCETCAFAKEDAEFCSKIPCETFQNGGFSSNFQEIKNEEISINNKGFNDI